MRKRREKNNEHIKLREKTFLGRFHEEQLGILGIFGDIFLCPRALGFLVLIKVSKIPLNLLTFCVIHSKCKLYSKFI